MTETITRSRSPGPIANNEAAYRLTPLQEGMLYHNLSHGESGVDVQQLVCVLHENLEIRSLECAWQRVTDRHEALRSRYRWKELARPTQTFFNAVRIGIAEYDWRGLSSKDQDDRLAGYLSADRRRGFDLTQPPLFRLASFRMAAHDYTLVWTFHHIIADGRSLPVILNEVFTVYEALCRGDDLRQPAPGAYSDFLLWLQEQDLSAAETYWRSLLKGFTSPTRIAVELDGNCERALNSTGSARFSRHEMLFSERLTEDLRTLARQLDVTVNTLVQGAWGLLLGRYSGEEDVLFGATRAGRHSTVPNAEHIVGMFINSLPMRVQLPPSMPVAEYLQAVRRQHVGLREVEQTPLAKIREWSSVPGNVPLFDSLVVFENYDLQTMLQAQEGDWRNRRFQLLQQTGFPLTVAACLGPKLTLRIGYDQNRFDGQVIVRMAAHLRSLLEGMAANPSQRLDNIPMLTATESHQLLVTWNDSARDYPRDASIGWLFEQQVDRTPDAVAVVDHSQQANYREINSRAEALAGALRQLGVATEQPIGLWGARSLESVIGLLGILKAGAAYVPLPVDAPVERIRTIVADAGLGYVVSNHGPDWLAGSAGVQLVQVPMKGSDNELSSGGRAVPGGDAVACLIYTSGTTGAPKGTCLTHRGLVNLLIHRTQNQFHVGDFDVAPLTAPLHFDGSIVQMFSPLITGGTLVIARTVSELAESPWYDKLTALTGASSLIAELVLSAGVPRSARVIGLGAEPIPAELLERIVGSSTVERLVTGYGVTECSCYSTDTVIYARPSESDCSSSPGAVGKLNCVGRPIANTQVYVLDGHGQLAPIGVPGELFLAGDGLAREYWNRPELTDERFVQRPVIPGRRLYRTGDRACWGADGSLHFLGRFDHQIKLQGFRIEPGEIEAILIQHEQVQQALVLLREDSPGDRRLVAYVIPRQTAARPEPSELRCFLQKRLPDYMLPSAFVMLDAFPLTSNGKVDRRNLPAPAGATRPMPRETRIASDPLTYELTTMWRQLLRVEAIDIQDDFFVLGGHSLLALRLIVQIQKSFGVQLPISSLFQGPTIEQLVLLLKSRLADTAGSTLRTDSDTGPALFCVANAFGIAPYFATGMPTYELAAEQEDVLAHSSIESLAAAYVKKVCDVQPRGPYYLTGHSASGIVAYEMAQQLTAQGDRVACLAILDTQLRPPPLDFHAGRLAYFANRLRHHAGQLARRHPSQWGNYLTRPMQTLSKLIGTKVGTDSASSQFTWWRELFRLQASYRPLPYTGQITLILPQETPRELIQDKCSEWSRLSPVELDVIMVPGDHNTMIQEPNVRVLAAKLKSRLVGGEKRAQSRDSTSLTASQPTLPPRLLTLCPNQDDPMRPARRRGDCGLSDLPICDSGDSVACRSLVVYAAEEPSPDGAAGGARYRWPRLSNEIRQLGVLRPDAIRVRIATVGICGTDLHLLEASVAGYVRCSSPMKIPPQGRIIGHEAVGIVTVAGAGQVEFSVGDVVCLESIVTCQHCRMCRQGRFNQCERSHLIGLEQDGLFTEFADVPASLAHKVTDLAKCDRDFESLACVEPAAVAYLACQNARITPGETVVVQGAGPIGFYAAMMARGLFGASLVTISEPSEFRREFARRVADVVLSPEQLLDSNSRFDVVIEASGALDGASRLIPRLDGNGRLVLLARTGQPLNIEHVDAMISRSLQIIGSRGHLGGAFGAVLDLVRRRRIDLRQPVTRVLRGFDELADALRDPHRLVTGDCKVVGSLTNS